jgi:hypothetical protein
MYHRVGVVAKVKVGNGETPTLLFGPHFDNVALNRDRDRRGLGVNEGVHGLDHRLPDFVGDWFPSLCRALRRAVAYPRRLLPGGGIKRGDKRVARVA